MSLHTSTLPHPVASHTILDQLKDASQITVKETLEEKTTTENKNLLIVSPYIDEPHLLDLYTVELESQLLAKALVGLKCLRDDYATSPYNETFNWSEVITSVQQLIAQSNYTWQDSKFYIVVFRSQVPPTTVYADLGVLDKAAHAEAMASGGFLKYWFGTPNEEGRNLATCVWRSQYDARVGSVGPAHRIAAGAARANYTEWAIERLCLSITDGAREWGITKWID
ncbi:hypothetical protein F5884DRAFT_365498 [Xylogone sp. PMI_703]|nr:hypothetical protein F5884DRAFT_365498 [Xylogone sp. PMI_703]